MKPRLQRWPRTLAAKLVALALVPACAMALLVASVVYLVTRAEGEEALHERGRFLAATLAQAAQYGIVSGNADAVATVVRGIAGSDPSIVGVRVLDAGRRTVGSAGPATTPADALRFEEPIVLGVVDVDLYDTVAARSPASRTVGWVEVDLSPVPLLRVADRRLLVGLAIVLGAAALCGGAGLLMAAGVRRPLQGAMDALRNIRDGHYELRLLPRVPGELGELQISIEAMARTLGARSHELEERVAERTRELNLAIERLSSADAEKRRLIARGNALVEEERRRIAAEIHDDLNSALVAMRLLALSLADDARKARQKSLAAGAEHIARRIDELYRRARGMVKQLRPEVLDALGLVGAIEELVRQYDEIHPRCRFRLRAPATLGTVADDLAIAVYRLLQEALTNVVKHAEATECTVSIARSPHAGALRVVVEDNGVGMPALVAANAGLGLVGMRERVAAFGGSMVVDAAAGGGTRVEATIPLPGLQGAGAGSGAHPVDGAA